MRTTLLLLLLSCLAALPAQRHEDVTFTFTATVAASESVYLLGDLSELGQGNLARSIRMAQPSPGAWRITVQLPRNRPYTWSFYRRSNAMTLVGNPSHGVLLGGPFSATTGSTALVPAEKRIVAYSTLPGARLHWRQDAGAWQSTPVSDQGPGRTAGERLVQSWAGRRLEPLEFYLSDASGTLRDPPFGSYSTPLDAFLLQDGEVFTYAPAPNVSPARRDYTAANLPAVQSAILGETRTYRVILPRGYDQHTWRRYPVLYWHDGPWMFDTGSPYYFPSNTVLDLGGSRMAQLVRRGEVGECIMVAVDWGANVASVIEGRRVRDYLPPGSGYDFGYGWIPGAADRYAAFLLQELKSVIDATYRTLPGREHTFVAGLSFGGVAAAYLGWDFSASFSRVGCFSPSFWVAAFPQRLRTEPLRTQVRWYLDSGDDNYDGTELVRTNWLGRGQPYQLERELRYFYDPGAQHVLSHWTPRLDRLCSFLYPASEEPNEFLVGGVPYGQGSGPSPLQLAWQPSTAPQRGSLVATAAVPGAWPGLGVLALADGTRAIGGVDVLVDLRSPFVVPIAADPLGVAATALELAQPGLLGMRLFAQCLRIDAAGWSASNGVELNLGY